MDNKKVIPLQDISSAHHHNEQPREYPKLAMVILGITAISVLTFLAFDGSGPYQDMSNVEAWLAQFMGVFFIVFAIFKFVNLQSFVHGFMMYDVIAKKSKAYATIYPFLQLALGVSMFVVPHYAVVHLAAALVSGIALLGVVLSLKRKQKIQCACLGNVIKMPLATVSGIEDGSMFVISLYMFFVMWLNLGL